MQRRLIGIPLLASALFVAGCGAWKGGRPVAGIVIDAPTVWKESGTGGHATAATGWLATFRDPALERHVREALARNQDLAAAAARLQEAREGAAIGRAARLPSLTAGLDGRSVRSENGSAPATSSTSYDLSLNAAWETDLWGRLRDLERASFADYEAALADFRGARLSLAANTAKAWYNLITATEQVTLARQTLDSFERNLRAVERSYRGGVPGVGALDVQLARTNVSSARRSLENTTLDREEAARTLEIFLSRYPAGEMATAQTLPTLEAPIPAGLPAGMIERRPDLAAARARLFASALRVEATRKQLLPDLRLTASGGTASSSLGQLLDRNLLTSAVNASLFQIITDGGRTEAEARAALARNQALVADYIQACLLAFREVESGLAADRSLRTQETFLVREVEQAALAERQATRDYTEGIDADILRVLESQRRASNARASLIRLRNDLLQNRIDLFLALGGDFATPAPAK